MMKASLQMEKEDVLDAYANMSAEYEDQLIFVLGHNIMPQFLYYSCLEYRSCVILKKKKTHPKNK